MNIILKMISLPIFYDTYHIIRPRNTNKGSVHEVSHTITYRTLEYRTVFPIMPFRGLRLLFISSFILYSHGLVQTSSQRRRQIFFFSHCKSRLLPPARRSTALSVFFASNNDKKLPNKNNSPQNATSSNADLLQTLQLKDEALGQAQRAVSSLESALESAVSNLETMQQQLQRKVKELEEDLRSTKGELTSTQNELKNVKLELSNAQEELNNTKDARDGLDWALRQSQDEARVSGERVKQLEAYLASMGVDASSVQEEKVEVSVVARTVISLFCSNLTSNIQYLLH